MLFMNKKRLLQFIAIILLLLIATSCSKKKEYNTFCTITGSVVDNDTSDAVPGATVTLSPSGKNTYTGSDGHFEFVDLDANQYTLTVQKSGYVTNRKTVTTEAGGTINVSITLNKTQ